MTGDADSVLHAINATLLHIFAEIIAKIIVEIFCELKTTEEVVQISLRAFFVRITHRAIRDRRGAAIC